MAKKLLCVIVLMLALVCVLTSCGHEHNFGEWETTKVATCTEEGSKERFCSCGEKQVATILINDNAHDYTEKNTTDKYLKSESDNNNPAIYYYSCKCGKIGTDTFAYEKPLDEITGNIPDGVYMAPYLPTIKIYKDNVYIYRGDMGAFLEYSYKYYVEDYEIQFNYQRIKLLNPGESTIARYNEIKNSITEDITQAYPFGEKTDILLSNNAFNIGDYETFIKIDESSSAAGNIENGIYAANGVTFKIDGNLIYDYATNNGCQVAMIYKYKVVGTQLELEYQEMILINETPETLEKFEAFKNNPYLRFSDSETITITDNGFTIDTERSSYMFLKLT